MRALNSTLKFMNEHRWLMASAVFLGCAGFVMASKSKMTMGDMYQLLGLPDGIEQIEKLGVDMKEMADDIVTNADEKQLCTEYVAYFGACKLFSLGHASGNFKVVDTAGDLLASLPTDQDQHMHLPCNAVRLFQMSSKPMEFFEECVKKFMPSASPAA